MHYYFSSESVSEGHPDKLCDQVSDAILDAALTQDPNSRVAAETFATTGLILVGGEITTKAQLDIQSIVRKTVADIGYTNPEFGIDANSCSVLNAIHGQSPDIAQGVNEGEGLFKALGAGDQGMMFGYACKQTETLMPLPIYLAHRLVQKLATLRKSGDIPYLRPDAKAQISLEYNDRTVKSAHTIVVSTQHAPDVSQEQIAKDVTEHVIKAIIAQNIFSQKIPVFQSMINRAFCLLGGLSGDTGLTGRKIVVDTYGSGHLRGGIFR